jgi:hypothetical protein
MPKLGCRRGCPERDRRRHTENCSRFGSRRSASMGKKKAEPPPPPPPFEWPERYRPVNIVYTVATPDTEATLSPRTYEQKRKSIPWQFRPPMRHERTFAVEVEHNRPWIEERLAEIAQKQEEQRAQEARAKAASKGGKKRPGSGKPTPQ